MEFEAEQADEVVAWLSGADAGGSDAPAGSIPHAPLYNQGLICAGCHLRNYQVYGPPGNEALPPLEPDVRLPHDGGQTRDAFESSRFCAACHQFEPDEYALNGKLFENTFEEWKASPQAKEGKSCQSCHMPGRRHLWRGIHDKVTVQSGVGITLNEVVTGNNRISGVLTLSNTGVGHRFPTYITPRVVLEAFQQDAQAGYPGREGICRQGSSLLRHLRWPLFRGKRVVIIGGGNSALEAAIEMSGLAAHVSLISRGEWSGDTILHDKVNASDLEVMKGFDPPRSTATSGSPASVSGSGTAAWNAGWRLTESSSRSAWLPVQNTRWTCWRPTDAARFM